MEFDYQKWLVRVTSLYLYLMFTVFLLVMPPKFYTGLTKTKFLVFSTFTLAALLSVIVLRLIGGVNGASFRGFYRRLPLCFFAFLAYLLVVLLSCAVSPYQDTLWMGAGRYEGLFTLLLYLAAFFVVAKYARPTKGHLYALGASITIICAIAMLQYYGIHLFYPGSFTFANSGFLSTIGNIDMLSGLLCLCFPSFIVAFLKFQDPLRYFFLLPAALSVFLILFMGVQSGKVGFLAILFLLLPVMLHNQESVRRSAILFVVLSLAAFLQQLLRPHGLSFTTGTKIFGALLLFAALLTVFVFTFGRHVHIKSPKPAIALLMAAILASGLFLITTNPTKDTQGTLYEIHEVLKGNFDDSFGSDRLFLWNRTIPLIREHPLLGTGPDSFRWAFEERFGGDLTNVYYDSAHNEYLQTAVNYGLLGLIAYLSAVALAIFTNIRHKYKAPIRLCALFSLLAYLIQAFFSFSVPIITPIFWIMLGITQTTQKDIVEKSQV